MSKDTPPFQPPIVLSFAASDPTGGAGVQADILTLASLGCHPLSVITALTVQDTAGVDGILPIDSDWVNDQARSLLEDMPVAAFKLGLLGSLDNIVAIANIVSDYPHIPLVLDPVLASGRGDQLVDEDMIAAMLQLLLPQTTLITPNALEARRLAQEIDELAAEDEAAEDADMALPAPGSSAFDAAAAASEEDELSANQTLLGQGAHARRLIEAGSELVLITGSHEHTPQVINTLYGRQGVLRSDAWERLPASYHGSGCTLASAIAAYLAAGADPVEAVQAAQEYTWRTLAAAFRPGMGQHLPDRFFWARDDDGDEQGLAR